MDLLAVLLIVKNGNQLITVYLVANVDQQFVPIFRRFSVRP